MAAQRNAGAGLKRARLAVPVRGADLEGLEIGTVVHLDGVIYTGRESLYKRLLGERVAPPVDLRSLTNVNFHCSPAASIGADGSFNVGALTATASFRFSHWMADWFALSGCRIIIGKGGMSEDDYKRHFVPNGAIYLTTVGYGTGALLGRGIKRVLAAHLVEELGIAQAMWVFEVENFGPLLVESDLEGNSLLERANRDLNKRVKGLYEGASRAFTKGRVKGLYEGLSPPALGRYGETTSREDELI